MVDLCPLPPPASALAVPHDTEDFVLGPGELEMLGAIGALKRVSRLHSFQARAFAVARILRIR